MSLRPPQSLSGLAGSDLSKSPFEMEAKAEQAASLGRAGRRAEAALKALAHAEEGRKEAGNHLARAADAVWSYLVLRQEIGLHNDQEIFDFLDVPTAVIARLGARGTAGRP
jgi:hypothetical protein